MRKVLSLFILLLIVSLFTMPLNCDTMVITTNPDNVLIQPYQIAAISWENNYEVMLLGTSIYAYQKDAGVQILPLPSVPSVELGNTDSLKKIVEMYQEAYQEYYEIPHGSTESITVIFEKVLGPHHLMCLRVEEENFVDHLVNYARTYNINITIKQSQLRILADYVARGYKYFLVDIVDVSNRTNLIQPLIIKFKTDHIWFPLYISSSYYGYTHIYILIITRKIPRIPRTISREFNVKRKIISRQDIVNIDKRLLEPFMFGYYFMATFLQKDGFAFELEYDIEIREFYEIPSAIAITANLIPLFFICIIAIPLVSKRFRGKLSYNITKRYLAASIFMLIFSLTLLLFDGPLYILFVTFLVSSKVITYGIILSSLLQFLLMFVMGYSIFIIASYITKISNNINVKIVKVGSIVLRIMFDIILLILLISTNLLLLHFWEKEYWFIPNILYVHWIIVLSIFTVVPYLDLYETIKKALQK